MEKLAKEFLEWVYDRLVHVYNEPKNVDYMIKFRGVLDNIYWKYTSEELPPDNDVLYYVAYVSRNGKKVKVGDVYLTGHQIRNQVNKGYWWKAYAYLLYEEIIPPPVK